MEFILGIVFIIEIHYSVLRTDILIIIKKTYNGRTRSIA